MRVERVVRGVIAQADRDPGQEIIGFAEGILRRPALELPAALDGKGLVEPMPEILADVEIFGLIAGGDLAR
jgi:hypothetical protein